MVQQVEKKRQDQLPTFRFSAAVMVRAWGDLWSPLLAACMVSRARWVVSPAGPGWCAG